LLAAKPRQQRMLRLTRGLQNEQ